MSLETGSRRARLAPHHDTALERRVSRTEDAFVRIWQLKLAYIQVCV